MSYQKKIGYMGEKLAADYLKDQGYQLLDQNYNTRYGELDLVMLDNGSLVFVEVKTRTSEKFGPPEASITSSKLAHIQDAGLLWMQEHSESPDDWRIDVVSILLDQKGQIKNIHHFINADL